MSQPDRFFIRYFDRNWRDWVYLWHAGDGQKPPQFINDKMRALDFERESADKIAKDICELWPGEFSKTDMQVVPADRRRLYVIDADPRGGYRLVPSDHGKDLDELEAIWKKPVSDNSAFERARILKLIREQKEQDGNQPPTHLSN